MGAEHLQRLLPARARPAGEDGEGSGAIDESRSRFTGRIRRLSVKLPAQSVGPSARDEKPNARTKKRPSRGSIHDRWHVPRGWRCSFARSSDSAPGGTYFLEKDRRTTPVGIANRATITRQPEASRDAHAGSRRVTGRRAIARDQQPENKKRVRKFADNKEAKRWRVDPEAMRKTREERRRAGGREPRRPSTRSQEAKAITKAAQSSPSNLAMGHSYRSENSGREIGHVHLEEIGGERRRR